MSDEQLKCEQRIDGQLEGRLGEMRAINTPTQYHHKCQNCSAEWDSEEEDEFCPECSFDEQVSGEEIEREEIEPLWIDKRTVFKVQLSTGGPGDEFDVYVDSDGDIEEIEYTFLDWWDGAHRVLHGGDFDTAKEYFENLLGAELDEIRSQDRRR